MLHLRAALPPVLRPDRSLAPATPVGLLVGLGALCLLLGDLPGVIRVGLCWLAAWVFLQIFQQDALYRGSFYTSLAYALLTVCLCFFISRRT